MYPPPPLRRLLLENLPVPLLEKAFLHLCNPEESDPPKELHHLSQLEWVVVSQLLDSLMSEKQHHPVQ